MGDHRSLNENLRRVETGTFWLIQIERPGADSINIFNGMVGRLLGDGPHHLPWDEFLNKDYDFRGSDKVAG